MRKLTKKMKVKDENGVRKITQTMLRGGMQDRVYRQEIIRHGDSIREHVKRLEERENKRGQSIIAKTFINELEDFKEPTFRRIRSRGGFFNE